MRSPEFQRQWFEQVARSAQRWPEAQEVRAFFDHIEERLDKGAREYGENQWREIGLLAIIREAREEGADIPGWLVLGAQALNEELAAGELGADAATEIQADFLAAAALGLLAHERLAHAAKRYRVARSEARWREKVREAA